MIFLENALFEVLLGRNNPEIKFDFFQGLGGQADYLAKLGMGGWDLYKSRELILSLILKPEILMCIA